MKDTISYIVTAVSLIGMLFVAGQKWGELNQRVADLEKGQLYYHGDYHPGLK